MIQFITEGIQLDGSTNRIKYNRLHEPMSLDEFAINIIDLRSEDIWKYEGDDPTSINCIDEISNLDVMIKNSNKTKIVIILPQDIKYMYEYYEDEGYEHYINLRTNSKCIVENLHGYILENYLNVFYEKSQTSIGDKSIFADFYFKEFNHIGVLTRSKGSNKATTIKANSKIITTLDIKSEKDMLDFLRVAKLLEEREEKPEWLEAIQILNDSKLKEEISNNEVIITDAKEKIQIANNGLEENNKLKSILYTNGDSLVEVVFQILEELLECDLSGFIDDKKEDFIINKDNKTFIGEIKGVTSNVKSEHISQLEVHTQSYNDKLQDNGDCEEIKSILIINHQRKNPLINRQPVHENQINLAVKYDTLIIETKTLLELYEKYKKNEIDRQGIMNIFNNDAGLLKI